MSSTICLKKNIKKEHLITMSEKVKNLLMLAENKTLLNEDIEEREWDLIDSLSESETEELYSRLSGAAKVRYTLCWDKRYYQVLAQYFTDGKIDFNQLTIFLNDFKSNFHKIDNFSQPKTEKEKKYGYSWAFLYICNKYIRISLRNLESLTGVGKDVIHRYINKYLESIKLEWDKSEAEHQLRNVEKRMQNLNF